MKKIISLLVAIVMTALIAVPASAASVAKFNINLISETDKEAVISFDFEGGTGFSGLDFEIIVNDKKVKVIGAENGTGFENFLKQTGSAFALINKDTTPVKATMVTLTAFRVVDGKDLFVITLKKLSKETLTSDDVKINITNCIDASQQLITTSVTTDLQGETTTTVSTSAAATPSETQTSQTQPSSASSLAQSDGNTLTNAVEPNGEVINDGVGEATGEQSLTQADENDDNTKTVVIAVAAVVFVGIVAVVSVLIIKKRKTDSNVIKETENEE